MIKNKSRTKNRPVIGVLMVMVGLFLLLGSSCGLVGELMASVSRHLVGRVGTMILVLTAWTTSYVLIAPPGALSRLVGLFVERFVGRSRQRGNVKPTIGKIRKMEGREALVHSVRSPSFAKQVACSMKLRDVCSALKNLGYRKEEYEPVMAGLDPDFSTEVLLRSALDMLRVN